MRRMKAVIPAAGLGTRLLPATKEQPKEMLPIFDQTIDGKKCVKPFVQLVFEKLYDSGIISLDELVRLSEEELARIPGVSEAKAGEIKKEVGFSE